MPTKPPSPCRAPGCPRLIQGGGYCPEHKHLDPRRAYDAGKRRFDPALAEAARLRNTARWRKLSAIVRAEEPLCRDPFGIHAVSPALTEQAHHIIGLTVAPSLAYTRENLAGVCSRCHSRLEALEREGKATSGLFTPKGVTTTPKRAKGGIGL